MFDRESDIANCIYANVYTQSIAGNVYVAKFLVKKELQRM